MRHGIAVWSILVKDMRTYYLKPPNVSWGLIFPLAWTSMVFLRSGAGLDALGPLLPGLVAMSVLFGSTSVLAVAVTFEKQSRSFERLLLAPLPLELLMLAKTAGAEQRRLLDELGAPLSIVLSRLELMLTELDDRAVPPTLAGDLAVLHRHTERMVCLLETLRARRLSWPDP